MISTFFMLIGFAAVVFSFDFYDDLPTWAFLATRVIAFISLGMAIAFASKEEGFVQDLKKEVEDLEMEVKSLEHQSNDHANERDGRGKDL